MKTPRASFVIPVYNGQAYLAETLESCIKQTNKRWEAVIIDDGSTDHTQEIIAYYQKRDERIVPILLPKNAGRSNARNVGIEAAQSDIILTLDADDVNIPDRVAQTLEFFKKHPRIDICYSKFHNIDEWGSLYTFKNKDGVEFAEIDAQPFDIERTKKTLFTGICHSSMAFKKKVFGKVKYSTGDFCSHAVEDWKFQVDAYNAGFRFGIINRVLVQYRAVKKDRDEAKIKEMKLKVLEAA